MNHEVNVHGKKHLELVTIVATTPPFPPLSLIKGWGYNLPKI